MEKLDINYSLKNIPIPSNNSYLIKLIEKIKSVVKQMHLKENFLFKENSKDIFGEKTPGLNQNVLHYNANLWKHS